MSNLNVLISGSGIAGTVFAACLLRAYPNANITIVERDPSLRLTGASVDIRSSAVDIIKWMGVEQAIREQTTNEEGEEFVDADGKAYATLRATGNSEIQSFTSEFEIFRGALAKIFLDPIIDRVKLVFDETVDHFEERDDGVAVTFTKSKEVQTYDLLVAADGVGSRIRGKMLNCRPQEHVFNDGVHIAFFTIKADLLQGSRLAQQYNAPRGRGILLRPDPDPAGRTRANLINVTTAADLETRARLNAAIREGSESYMALMEEEFRDAGWLAPEVLRGMRDSEDFYCSLFGEVRAPKLQAGGHVVLLGDAGYATPGIGTSLAIIGGYVLAGELLKLDLKPTLKNPGATPGATPVATSDEIDGDVNGDGDIKTALERYEGIMLPFARSSQGWGSMFEMLNPQTRWGLGVRNLILRTVLGLRLDRLAVAVGSAVGYKEKKIDLPEYPWPAAR